MIFHLICGCEILLFTGINADHNLLTLKVIQANKFGTWQTIENTEKLSMETTKLIIRLLLLVTLLTTVVSAHAAERFLLSFEFAKGDKIIERGKPIVSQNQRVWKKGLQRNFLKLSCGQDKSGKLKRIYSTVDYFTGIEITHQLVENYIELTAIRTVAQARLPEIRALKENECKELSPLITSTTKTYKIPAENGFEKTYPYDENINFHAKLQSIGGTL